MDENGFVDKVKSTFAFLESEYGFRVTSEMHSPMHPLTDGAVDYTSSSTVVTIDSDLGCASVYFYRLQDGRYYSLNPVDIHEYLSTSEQEKDLLLSIDPADRASASALSNQKFLLSQPDWKGIGGNRIDLERDLRNFSDWLQAHASLCLKGDFSKWPDLYEYKVLRARAEYLRSGKDEQVNALVKDSDGKFKLIKQSPFIKEYEYIEKLRKEIST